MQYYKLISNGYVSTVKRYKITKWLYEYKIKLLIKRYISDNNTG